MFAIQNIIIGAGSVLGIVLNGTRRTLKGGEKMKDIIYQQNEEIKRRMIWINTCLIIFNLFISLNIAVWVLIDEFIYQAASFLAISLITLLLWGKWKKLVGENLK